MSKYNIQGPLSGAIIGNNIHNVNTGMSRYPPITINEAVNNSIVGQGNTWNVGTGMSSNAFHLS